MFFAGGEKTVMPDALATTTDPSTPLMRQYNAIKQQVPHAQIGRAHV